MAFCVSTFPETAHFAKTLWLVGCVLASIAYGVLLVLAHSCFQALRRRKRGSPFVNRGLTVYVLLVVVITTAAEAIIIQRTLPAVLDDTCIGPYSHVFHPYFGPPNVVSFLITLLTDGVLVWRCYAITSGVGGSRLLWLTPLVSYIVTFGLSITLSVELFEFPKSQAPLAVLFPLQLGTSVFLNALITSIIVTLLFLHRRMLIRIFGGEQQLPLLNIMTILIESAALIVFVDIAEIVTVSAFNSIGDMVSLVWTFAQPIASLLIIDRVSRDSDYFSQKKDEALTVSASSFVKPLSSSPIPPPSPS